jgi:hypothetical protein
MAELIVTDLRRQDLVGEPEMITYCGGPQVDDSWGVHLTGDDTPLKYLSGQVRKIELVIDQMAICLGEDTRWRSPEIKHLVSAGSAPAPTGTTRLQLLPFERAVALELSLDARRL